MSIYTILLRFGDRTALLLTILKTTSITQRKWYWTGNCMECRNCVMTNHESRQTLTSGSLSFTVESTWVAYAQRNYQVVFRKGLRTKRFRNLQRHNRRTNSREHFVNRNRSSSCDRITPKYIFSVSAVNIATSEFITTTDLGFALIHFFRVRFDLLQRMLLYLSEHVSVNIYSGCNRLSNEKTVYTIYHSC